MKEKAKQLLPESSKIDELTLLFGGEVVNEMPMGQRGGRHFTHCPIFSVPNVPIPLRRNANTTRFSFRKPTLKV